MAVHDTATVYFFVIAFLKQDILDLEMPDLPEDQTPQEVSDVSIDIHFPSFDDAEVSGFLLAIV